MWAVLRRQQGEFYEREDHVKIPRDLQNNERIRKMDISLRTIAMHETKPYAAEKDPLVLTAPYGNVVYGKIVRNLSHDNVVLRRQAVQMLLDLYLLQGEHVILSLNAGVLDALLERLADADDDMRTQACIALEFIVKQPKGQEVVLSRRTQVLERLLAATNDECSDVVVEALRLLGSTHAAYNEHEATRRLIRLGAIPQYIKKVLDRDDAICSTACSALVKVFDVKEAFIEFVEHGGVEAVTKALSRADEPMILVEASEVISRVAIYGLGLKKTTSLNTIRALLPHIRYDNVAVRTSTTAALAQLVVHADGKVQAMAAGAVATLAAALDTEDERDVLMNLVKAIRLISEHPDARRQLRESVGRIKEILSLAEEYEPLLRATQSALESIEWTPGIPLP